MNKSSEKLLAINSDGETPSEGNTEKAQENFIRIIEALEQKNKERQLDKRRSFYKWLVLAQKERYMSVLDTIIRNSKLTPSKVAYLFFMKSQQAQAPLDLSPEQKQNFQILLKFAQIFEVHKLREYSHFFIELKHLQKSAFAKLLVRKVHTKIRNVLNELKENNRRSKQEKAIELLSAFFKDQASPITAGFFKTRIFSECKKRRHFMGAQMMERALKRKINSNQMFSISKIKEEHYFNLKVRVLTTNIQRVIDNRRAQYFRLLKDMFQDNSSKQARASTILYQILKKILYDKPTKIGYDSVKSFCFRRENAAQKLIEKLAQKYNSSQKSALSKLKKLNIMNDKQKYEQFANYYQSFKILENVSKSGINDLLNKAIEKQEKRRRGFEELRQIFSKKIGQNLQNSFGNILNKPKIGQLLRNKLLEKFIVSQKKKGVQGLDNLRGFTRMRSDDFDREKQLKLVELKNVENGQMLLRSLFNKKINQYASSMMNNIENQSEKKRQVLNRLRGSLLLKKRVALNKLSTLIVEKGNKKQQVLEQGFNYLASIFKWHNDRDQRLTFNQLKRQILDRHQYKILLLKNLFEKRLESDNDLKQIFLQRLRNNARKFGDNKADLSKQAFFIARVLKNKMNKGRAFDLWKKTSDFENDYLSNNVNWSASFQYSKGLGILDKMIQRNTLKYGHMFFDALNTSPKFQQLSILCLKLRNSYNRKLTKAFFNLSGKKSCFIDKEKGSSDNKLINLFREADYKYRCNMMAYFVRWKSHIKLQRIKAFTKVVGNQILKKEFDRLRIHSLESEALEAKFLFKFEKCFGISLKSRINSLGSVFSKLRQLTVKSDHKNYDIDKGLESLKRIFTLKKNTGFYSLKMHGMADSQDLIRFSLNRLVGILGNKGSDRYLELAFQLLKKESQFNKMKDDYNEQINDRGWEIQSVEAIKSSIQRLVKAYKHKQMNSFSKMIIQSNNEGHNHESLVNDFRKIVTDMFKSQDLKKEAAFKKLVTFSNDKNYNHDKALRLLINIMKSKKNLEVYKSFGDLNKQKYRENKLKGIFDKIENKFRTGKRIAFGRLIASSNRKKLQSQFVILLQHLVQKRKQKVFSEIKYGTKLKSKVRIPILKLLLAKINASFNKRKREGLFIIKENALEQIAGPQNLLEKCINRSEKRYSGIKGKVFGMLREQKMLKELSLIYYVGLTKLHNLSKKKLMSSFYSIKCEERFQSYRHYYNNFWKLKMGDVEVKLFEREKNSLSNRHWGKVLFSNCFAGMDGLFLERKRKAFSKMKDMAFQQRQNDKNTKIQNNMRMTLISSLSRKWNQRLLRDYFKHWSKKTQASKVNQGSDNKYLKWIYSARLEKLISRILAKQKRSAFSDLVDERSEKTARKERINLRLMRNGFIDLNAIFFKRMNNYFRSLENKNTEYSSPKHTINTRLQKYQRNASGTRLIMRGLLGKSTLKLINYVNNAGERADTLAAEFTSSSKKSHTRENQYQDLYNIQRSAAHIMKGLLQKILDREKSKALTIIKEVVFF